MREVPAALWRSGAMSIRLFQWLSVRPLPPRFDLRRRGWVLSDGGDDPGEAGGCPVLVDAGHLEAAGWVGLLSARGGPARGRVLLLGVGDAQERARLLHRGFGDVLGRRVALPELEARAARIAATDGALPRRRSFGPLMLDLMRREGFVGGKALGLHPREFALIWRLLETPGEVLTRAALYAQVWRLNYLPETNSIAVHVFRLRRKLAQAGLGSLLRTAPSGGYYVALPDDRPFALTGLSAAAPAR